MATKNKYEIDEKLLDFFQSVATNKYKPLFSVMDNNAKVLARKTNADPNELSELVNRYTRLFSSVVEGVSSQFNSDSLMDIVSSKDAFLVAYASNIAAKTVAKDIEYALENDLTNRSQHLQKDNTSFNKKAVCWGEASYTHVRAALEGMIQYCSGSSKTALEGMRDYFTMYANATNDLIKSKVGKDIYNEIKDVAWKIGSHELDGLKPIVVVENINSNKKVNDREKEQFYTPLPNLITPKALPRNRIIGDQTIITDLERMVKALFMYNDKAGKNSMTAKNKFHQRIILGGTPGEGKGEVCHYLIDYAKDLSAKIGRKLKVTYFEFESSFFSGEWQKLKSQLKQITEGNDIYLIFQDELDQILQEKNRGKDTSNNDTIKEFQKFLQGQYINKGNYLIIATSNVKKKLPWAIRDRFIPYSWRGAETKEQKALLFKFKLEDGIEAGYINIEDQEFQKLGELAYQYNLTGRNITDICNSAKADAFRWEKLGEIYKLRDDYNLQLTKIDELNDQIYFKHVRSKLISFVKNRNKGDEDSIKYDEAVA